MVVVAHSLARQMASKRLCYVPDLAVPLTPFDNALPYWDPWQLCGSCVGIEMNRTVGGSIGVTILPNIVIVLSFLPS